MKKRILSILLAALMLLSAVPLGMVDTAYAAAALASGKCGDSATWTLDSAGTLTISGTGATYNYDMDDDGNSAAPWCTKARIQRVNKVVVNSGITELGYSMFSNCTQLTSVSLPGGLKRIGSCLFLGCTRLSAITIPSSVTTIESNAFTHCDSITAITLPSGLRTMGDAVCSQMAKLTTATVSSGVTYLSNYAFNDCPSLKTITLPNTVRSIGICAFRYDTALKDVYFNGSVTQWTSIQIAGEGNSALYNADVHCSGLPAPTVTGGNDSQGRPTLKWNAVSGAAKYEVYRARSKDGDYIKYSTVTGTSYTNTSYIENGNTYYYKVRALNANGTAGAWSSVVSVTYKQTLSAPTVTGGNDSQGRPTLTWNAVSGAAKYEVYRARSKDGDYIKYSTVTGTSYTNTSYIENGNTYYYKVRALKSDGTAGAWSSVVSVTYKQTLSAPTVTGSTDSQGRPTLKWNAVTGAAKYEVYRARSKDGDYTKYSTTTGTAYTNSSYLTSGATYYYKVRALDANGTAGAWSSIVSVTYKQTLSAPTVTGGNDSQGRPTLTWKAVSGAAKYEVYRARSRSGEYIKYSTVTGTSYTNTSYIEDGNTYYYKVRALDADGTAGAWSSVVSVTYKQTLSAPAVTGGNDAQGRPTLKWNAVSGAAKYEIYRSYSRDGSYSKYSTQTSTSYTNSSYLTSGTTYYYKVRALKSDGTAGPYSAVVSVTCRLKLSAPSVTGGNDSQGRPTLKWNAVTGAAKYEVYRARSRSGEYIKYSTVTGTSYTNTSYIEDGNTYYYKVRALKSDGTACAWSSVVSVTYRKPAAATVASGKCGDSAAWKLDAEGTLTISGTGATYDFFDDYNYTAPWYDAELRLQIKKAVVNKGITYVGSCAFIDCAEMTSVSLPTTLETMGASVFMDCTSLTSVTIPDGVTFISGDFFRGCTSLKSVTLPDSLRETGGCTFMYCTSLTSVRLPATLLSISWQMFKDCKSLTSLTIPRSVVNVKQDAFSGCTALKNVTYTGTTADWKALTIYSGNEALTRANVRCTGSTVLTAPTLTLSVSKKGQPTLKWSAVSGAAGYQLWCSYDSGDGTGPWYHWLTNLDKGTASFTDDRELEKGRTYTYKVRAVTSSGAVGSFSKEVTFTYNPAASLAAPTVTAGLDDQGYPALTWPAVPDAARYEVYRAASEDGNFAQLAAVTSNSYTNSAVLTDGAAYYYKVRALDSDGEAGPFSDVVSVTYTARPALVAGGKCGDSASWKLDADGVLTITGAGPMADYSQPASDNCAPWRTYANDIKKVVVQKGVTAIGSYAFASLERVTSVTLPEGVTSIGSSAFENCGLMAYGGLGAVTLPEGLTAIGSSAFSGSYMDSLTLPESLRTIGGAAFEKSPLKTLTIPGGVTSIGNGAFSNSHLTSIQLPDGAQLGAMLFYQCYELTDVTLPADLTVIGDSMFENCTKLTHVTIPSGVTRIEREAFAMCGALEEIRLPEGVETIGVIAFSGCVAMTSAYLPRSLTTIESGAFSACRSLTDVYYGGTAAEWAAISVADRNDPLLNAALHCTGAALVDSGKCGDSASWKLDADGVLTITGAGPMADYGAYGPWYIAHLADINKVVVQEGVTTIGDYAFANLSYVTSVTIPSSITSIGAHAFEKCRLGGAVTLPEGLTVIGDFAFSGSGMASLTLPESLRTIGNSAFLYCSLRELTIPSGVTSIGNGAFSNSHLTSIQLPDGAQLGAMLFYQCYELTDVTLPADLTVIGDSMFENCTKLTHVTIPSGVTRIEREAFAMCGALEEIRLPEGVESIGVIAFSGCVAMTGAYLPRSLTTIESGAFSACRSLTDVYYGGTAAEWLAISVADRNDPLLNAALHCTGQSASRLDVPAMTLGEDCSDGKPTVWWPAVTGAERYEIWRAQAASDGSAPAASAYTLIVSADVTFHKDTTAEADTWYYYKVRAVSGSTYSDFSQAARRYCEAPPTMDTPEITSLELDDSGKPVLTWRTVEGAARYQVFRSEDNGFSYSPMGTVLPTGSDTITWTDTTAVSGTGYYYGVGCYDDNGHYSSFGGGDWWVTAR